jgi:hypothetical protein
MNLPLARIVCVLGWCSLALISIVHGAEPPVIDPGSIVPLPAVVSFAETNNISLTGLNLAPSGAKHRVGDTVAALVSLHDGGRQRQWLVRLTVVDPSEKERQKMERDAKTPPPEFFSTLGTRISLDSTQAILELRIVGPFHADESSPSKRPTDKRVRTPMAVGFLGLGLDRFALGVTALRSAAAASGGATPKLEYDLALKPFPAETVRTQRKIADALGFTPDLELGVVRGPVALIEFFSVVQNTPGLQEILAEMLDKASLGWSFLSSLGKLKPDITPDLSGLGMIVETGAWGPALQAIYRCPLHVTLNKKPVLESELWVTSPRSPILNSAGILGMLVRSTAYKDKVLIMRILAAQPGARASAL